MNIKAMLIQQLISVLLGMLTPELLKKSVDTFLDFVEDFVEDTENQYDDRAVLPICKLIRTTFDIPDND